MGARGQSWKKAAKRPASESQKTVAFSRIWKSYLLFGWFLADFRSMSFYKDREGAEGVAGAAARLLAALLGDRAQRCSQTIFVNSNYSFAF